MSPKLLLFNAEERRQLEHTLLSQHELEEPYANLEHQHETAVFGMWVFLASEVLFFGVLFLTVAIYRVLYAEAFAKAGEKLNWMIGSLNTIVLLVSSLSMVLSVHYTQIGKRRELVNCLALTAILGVGFLCLKGTEYYLDYKENLIPGWKFDAAEWVEKEHLRSDQVPQVKLFLLLYWIMTGLHALHVTIGIAAVLILLLLARRGHYSPTYYTPVDVVALYWHFVDIVWIFLLPTLYLAETHRW